MGFNMLKVVQEMGVFDQGILAVLLVMALCSLVVFFERVMAFRKSAASNREFARVATKHIEQDDYEGLAKSAESTKGSHLARLLGTGVKTFLSHSRRPVQKLSPIEATRRELVRESESLAADIRRGLSILASVGSVAPFVGLLGTVMGIIHSFQSIAKEGSGGLGAVSSGIAEALLVTAAGLVVAIPAVLAFNFLTTQSERLLLGLDRARGELVDHLENVAGSAVTAAHAGNGAVAVPGMHKSEVGHERRA